jgi:hypothetical protein
MKMFFTDYNINDKIILRVPYLKGYNFKMFHHLEKMMLNLITKWAQPKICASVFEIQEVCNITSHFVAGHTEPRT